MRIAADMRRSASAGWPLASLMTLSICKVPEMVRPVNQNLRIKAFGLCQAPLCVECERFRKDLRQLERRWLRHR